MKKDMNLRFQGLSYIHNSSSQEKIRILLLWNATVVSVTLMDMSEQLIHVRVDCRRSSSSFLATFVYGLHTKANRKPLWCFLNGMGRIIFEPWIVLGDFNSYLNPDDEQEGHLLITTRLLTSRIVLLNWNWVICKVWAVILHG